MGFFAFKFLHPRPLAGEGRGEGSEREVARAFLIPTSLWIIFLCLLFNQPLTSAQELRRILYGTTASPSHLPIWVAKDAGFFEQNDVALDDMRGGVAHCRRRHVDSVGGEVRRR